MRDTGFPQADVENDFLRARRRQFLATLAHRLRGGHGEDIRLARPRPRRSRSGWYRCRGWDWPPWPRRCRPSAG